MSSSRTVTRAVTSKMFVVAVAIAAGFAYAKSEADIGAPTWVSGNDYDPNDLVQVGSDIYRAKQKLHNDTTNPSSDPSNWLKLSGAAEDVASLGSDTNIHSTGTGITVKATRAAGAFSRSSWPRPSARRGEWGMFLGKRKISPAWSTATSCLWFSR